MNTPAGQAALHRLRRLALWSAAGGACAAVWLAYQNPHLVFALAGQVWACF